MNPAMQIIKRIFRKDPAPIDWFSEPKTVNIYRRGCGTQNQLINALFATDVNEPIVVVEYIERMVVEIMVSGGKSTEIAQAIFNNISAGVLTKGNRTEKIDWMKIPYKISFTEMYWIGDYHP